MSCSMLLIDLQESCTRIGSEESLEVLFDTQTAIAVADHSANVPAFTGTIFRFAGEYGCSINRTIGCCKLNLMTLWFPNEECCHEIEF